MYKQWVEEYLTKNTYIIHATNIVNFNPKIFNIEYIERNKLITGKCKGRGVVYFIKYRHQDFVVKKYYRGGLVSKILNDKYPWFGISNTRAREEFIVLTKLSLLGLPVPRVISARVVRKGYFYSADIMFSRIKNSETLSSRLCQAPLSKQKWFELGQILSLFHQIGVFHRDLNANNILITSQEKFYLIDFGKAKMFKYNVICKLDIYRLRRSLTKIIKKNGLFYFNNENWEQMIKGYKHRGSCV